MHKDDNKVFLGSEYVAVLEHCYFDLINIETKKISRFELHENEEILRELYLLVNGGGA